MEKQSSIISEVAKETGFSKEIIRQVTNNFWLAIKYYIKNPLESRMGIRLKYFGVFEIRKYFLLDYVGRIIFTEKIDDEDKGYVIPLYKMLKRLINEKKREDVRFRPESKWGWFYKSQR